MAVQVLVNTKDDLVVRVVTEYTANNNAPNITFALGAKVIDGVNTAPTSYSIRGIEYSMPDGSGVVNVYRANSTSNTITYVLSGQGVFDLINFNVTDQFMNNKEITVSSNLASPHSYTTVFYLKKGY